MRQLLRDADHLVRLAILFVVGATVLLVVRAVAVPEDFGKLGHFRASALDESRERPLRYAGRGACADCHDEAAVALAGGGHAEVGCESCHGPLATHAADPDAAAPAAATPCARCHSALHARPAGHPQVDVEAHAEGNDCTDCHVAHAPGME